MHASESSTGGDNVSDSLINRLPLDRSRVLERKKRYTERKRRLSTQI